MEGWVDKLAVDEATAVADGAMGRGLWWGGAAAVVWARRMAEGELVLKGVCRHGG